MTPFWRRWFSRREWDEELESHIVMRTEWNRQNLGLTEGESAELAKRQFGGKLRIRESVEDLHPGRLLADFAQDFSHAFRLFRYSPGLALMVIGTIAAGIGAATSIFSIVDPLLFRGLPFRNDKQLVSVGIFGPIDKNEFAIGGMYLEWRQHQTVFSSITAMRPGTQCDLQGSQTERVPCAAVQQNFLTTLGVAPVMGRNFTRSEDLPNAPRSMLVSSRIWRGYLGSRSDVIGKVVKLDDEPLRIIGVLPSDFVLPQGGDVDVLLPAQLDDRVLVDPASTVFLRAFARLKPGISTAQAAGRMAALFRVTIRNSVPAELQREVRPVIRSIRDRIIQEAKLASRMLLVAVALLLLMACMTVMNLLLARAHAKQGELEMRAALGASRNRLVRQCLTETLLLSLAGGVIGFALSWACVRLLAHAAPGGFLGLEKVHADIRALAFSTAATIFAMVLSGLLPALRQPHAPGGRNWRVTRAGTVQIRQALTSFQLASSLVLLTGALMFARSLSNLQSQQPGFSQAHLTAAIFRLNRAHYTTPQRISAFDDQLEARLKALPGVQAVALSDSMPPSGSVHGRPLSNMKVAGGPSLAGAGGMVVFRYVTPDYFRTLGIPLLRGRTFADAERTETEDSLVISETLAHRLFPSTDPIGGRVSLDGDTHWITIIGVVGDVKNNGITIPTSPEYYRLRRADTDQLGLTAVAFLRSEIDIGTLIPWIRREIGTLDPTVTTTFESMPERLRRLNDRPRFLTFVLVIFACVSVLLAGSGVYGVIAFLVSSRTREIGIRAALGATRRDILLLVQRQMFWCAMIGIAVGLCGSVALSGLVRGLLFQVSPRDPRVLLSVVLCLLAITLLAGWRPSWKAARTDPARALRVD